MKIIADTEQQEQEHSTENQLQSSIQISQLSVPGKSHKKTIVFATLFVVVIFAAIFIGLFRSQLEDYFKADPINQSPIAQIISQTQAQQKIKQQLNIRIQSRKRETENITVKVISQHTPLREHIGHEILRFEYATMGSQPNTTFNYTKVKVQDYYYYESAMADFLKPYNDTNCQLERMGDFDDGGYPLCSNFINRSVALINIGVQGRDKFGCELTSKQIMPNFMYDCTNNKSPQCGTNKKSNIFSSGCLDQISEFESSNQYYSLKDIIDQRNLTKKHITLKIDVQGAEWKGFRTFPLQYLQYVDQILMEIHFPGGRIVQEPLWGNLDIIKTLQKYFVTLYVHMNAGACISPQLITQKKRGLPAFAIQVTLVNRKVVELKSNNRAYVVQGKNRLYGMNNCDWTD